MAQAGEPTMAWLRRGDLWCAAAVLVTAALFLAFRAFFQPSGATAELTTPDGIRTLSLDKDTTLTVTGDGGIRVTVEVTDGAVRFQDSECPDRVCVNSGWLKRAGDTAACVPAGVVLRVTGTQTEVDAVAG